MTDRYKSHRPTAAQAAGNFAEWSVPWSDLMMVMFIVFAVLFVVTSMRKDAAPVTPPVHTVETKAPTDPMQAFLGQLNDPVSGGKGFTDAKAASVRETYYQSDNLGISVVRETDRQVRVFLRGDLFFAPGGDTLAGKSSPYLGQIAEILRVSNGAVLVIGHSDAAETKSPAESLGLSARRAASVAEYFIRTAGLDPKRFMITGRGAFQPETPDTDPNSALRNRRVEVLILTDV